MVALLKTLFSAPKKTPTSMYILHRAGKMEPISTMIFPDEVGYRLLWWKHCGADPPPPAMSIDPSILLGHIQHYAGDALDSICVTSLSYYKEKTSAQHQSLVINIEDYRFNVSNSIRIDRHYPAPVPTPQSSDSETSTSCLAEDDLPTPTYVFRAS
ncbi:hypothetical protein CTheo_9199 [Ceratobasidium theobromae]|uniref:Uncharacterized protein n=1 Tax=Ceratobasidium theobromae TaxID=1582974 RepID=A0A5N5Q5Z5_9AGAM|nr:hypothetical protein CTheo_9199 [Ceratobasidium theobromae]